MMVTSVLAAMSMVLVLLIVLVGLGLLRGFGTRWAGYALVSRRATGISTTNG